MAEQNAQFVAFKALSNALRQDSLQFWHCHSGVHFLRCLDIDIWRLTTDADRPITLPLVHARRVIIIWVHQCKDWVLMNPHAPPLVANTNDIIGSHIQSRIIYIIGQAVFCMLQWNFENWEWAWGRAIPSFEDTWEEPAWGWARLQFLKSEWCSACYWWWCSYSVFRW